MSTGRFSEEIEAEQRAVCAKYGAEWCPLPLDAKLGVARDVKSAVVPVHGLRHSPEGGTCGWYLWAGHAEIPNDPDFFVPLHARHLAGWRPFVLRFLGLPPGWRFLADGHHEDVWEDRSILHPAKR